MTASALALPDLDISKGVLCPECGCRRLPVEWTDRTAARTIRSRRCSRCGHRILTAEEIDRPGGGPVACAHCAHPRLLSAGKTRHRLLSVVRYRPCPACRRSTRTAETARDHHPDQPATPRPTRTNPFASPPSGPPPTVRTTRRP